MIHTREVALAEARANGDQAGVEMHELAIAAAKGTAAASTTNFRELLRYLKEGV